MSKTPKTAFIDVLDNPFFAFDDTGAIIDWNQSALATTGYDEDELAGLSLSSFFESRETGTDLTEVTGESVLEGELVTPADE